MATRLSIPLERIQARILVMRDQRVILDADLAALYGVSTKRLNEQVKRNARKFPEDFMFQLNRAEAGGLRSQIATSKIGRGGRRTLPVAFTEHGAIQAANVLNSIRACEISVQIVRAFVRLRQLFANHRVLAAKLEELAARVGGPRPQARGHHSRHPPARQSRASQASAEDWIPSGKSIVTRLRIEELEKLRTHFASPNDAP